MSKRKSLKEPIMSEEVEVVIEAEEAEVVIEAVAKKKAGGKKILVTLADGSQMSRQEYCIKRAYEGANRSTIANELSELQGKIVPFQIVFAATRHLEALFPKRVAKVADVVVTEDINVEG